MRATKVLRPFAMLVLAGNLTMAAAQSRLCSSLPAAERESVRALGECRDPAPIVDVAPQKARMAQRAESVPNVVGLSYDDARNRLASFKLQRTYRSSAEPAGTVLAQQPGPASRLTAGFPVTVVLSDGTLRPPPRVAPSEIDGVRTIDPPPSIAAATEMARPGAAIEQGRASSERAKSESVAEQLRVPNVLGMAVEDAHAQLGRFKVERIFRPSSAPSGRVVAQIPQAPARTEAGGAIVLVVSSGPARAGSTGAAPAQETIELPDVAGRSVADAGAALAEFKVDRLDMASAAPSGEVIAQVPAPGTAMLAGSTVVLHVSDGSLASNVATAPAVVPAPAPVTTPEPVKAPAPVVQSERVGSTLPSNALLMLVAGVLFGLALGAWVMRRWLLRSQPAPAVETPSHTESSEIETAVPTAGPPPEFRFLARMDAGETTIAFTASKDSETIAIEHPSDHHA